MAEVVSLLWILISISLLGVEGMDGGVEASSAVMSSLIWILISISPLGVEDMDAEAGSLQQVQQGPNCLGYYG